MEHPETARRTPAVVSSGGPTGAFSGALTDSVTDSVTDVPTDRPAQGCTVATVEMTITCELAPEALPVARAQLERVLSLRPRHLVLELADCSFLDAAAIGLLLDVHQRLWQHDGLLTLRSPSPRLRRVLRAARVDGVLDISPADGAGGRAR